MVAREERDLVLLGSGAGPALPDPQPITPPKHLTAALEFMEACYHLDSPHSSYSSALFLSSLQQIVGIAHLRGAAPDHVQRLPLGSHASHYNFDFLLFFILYI